MLSSFLALTLLEAATLLFWQRPTICLTTLLWTPIVRLWHSCQNNLRSKFMTCWLRSLLSTFRAFFISSFGSRWCQLHCHQSVNLKNNGQKYTVRHIKGHTQPNTEPHLSPSVIGEAWPHPQPIGLLTAPDWVGASLISNCRCQTFDIYDSKSGCLWWKFHNSWGERTDGEIL